MSRQETLAFQARWMRPAGIAAILAAALLVAAAIVGSVGSADTTAEELALYGDHSGRLVLSSVISALALILLIAPLYFLFRSARLRSERVRSFVGGLLVLGATLVAVQSVLFSIGVKDASDEYLAGVSAVEASARQAAQPQQKGPTTTTTAAPSVDRRVSAAKDDFADDKVSDSSKAQAARYIGLVGGLMLVAGTIYTLVWTMRTGLLTRFTATVGMAFIAALLILPGVGPVGLILWFAVIGLMLAGRWIRPLPPAWAAGEAVPWPKAAPRDQPQGDGPPGTVEGRGREVSEQPLPENGGSAEPPPRETQGQRRKKRKRRG
jgi:hypothetical protein